MMTMMLGVFFETVAEPSVVSEVYFDAMDFTLFTE